MQFVSVRVITGDVARLVAFYEEATGLSAAWTTEQFAELATPGGAKLAITGTATVPLFAPGAAGPGENRSAIIEFLVPDVDEVHRNLVAALPDADFVNEPTTMPWGNRSLLVRDPDGNLVNFFTPVSAEARREFAH